MLTGQTPILVLKEGTKREKGKGALANNLAAAKAIIAATRRNVATGDHFDVAIIDGQGFRELSEAEKGKLLAQFTTNS